MFQEKNIKVKALKLKNLCIFNAQKVTKNKSKQKNPLKVINEIFQIFPLKLPRNFPKDTLSRN